MKIYFLSLLPPLVSHAHGIFVNLSYFLGYNYLRERGDLIILILLAARVGPKFKPKAKLRPRKEMSESVTSVSTSDTKGNDKILCSASLETAKSTLPVGVVDDGLEIPVGYCLATTAANDKKEALENCEDSLARGQLKDLSETKNDSSEVVSRDGHLGLVDGSHQEVAVFNIGVNKHSGFRKPESEVKHCDLFLLEIGAI